jgi:hypothetical protein
MDSKDYKQRFRRLAELAEDVIMRTVSNLHRYHELNIFVTKTILSPNSLRMTSPTVSLTASSYGLLVPSKINVYNSVIDLCSPYLTDHKQPTLYWYFSFKKSVKVEE